jgi:hypothetical protein
MEALKTFDYPYHEICFKFLASFSVVVLQLGLLGHEFFGHLQCIIIVSFCLGFGLESGR